MKKTVLILLSAAGAFLLAFALWYGAGYLLSQKESKDPAVPQDVKFDSHAPLTVGSIAALRANFTLPRYRKVLNTAMTPGKGTALSMAPVISIVKYGWKENVYQLQAALCAIRPGESGEGTVELEISSAEKEGAPRRFTLKIPTLKIEALAVPNATTPEVAASLAAPPQSSPYRHLLWGLLLLLPLLWLLLRKKRAAAARPVSLRKRTLDALETLRKEVLSHNRSAKEGIAGVSDLLRNYLEERYSLPASGKTTPEFLKEMESNSFLPAKANLFLQNFLNTADMIKFAQAPCDGSAVATAVESAADLVENTSVIEEEEK